MYNNKIIKYCNDNETRKNTRIPSLIPGTSLPSSTSLSLSLPTNIIIGATNYVSFEYFSEKMFFFSLIFSMLRNSVVCIRMPQKCRGWPNQMLNALAISKWTKTVPAQSVPNLCIMSTIVHLKRT